MYVTLPDDPRWHPHLPNAPFSDDIVLLELSVKQSIINVEPAGPNASYLQDRYDSFDPPLALSIFLLITSAGTCSLLAFSTNAFNFRLIMLFWT